MQLTRVSPTNSLFILIIIVFIFIFLFLGIKTFAGVEDGGLLISLESCDLSSEYCWHCITVATGVTWIHGWFLLFREQ